MTEFEKYIKKAIKEQWALDFGDLKERFNVTPDQIREIVSKYMEIVYKNQK